MRWFVSRNGETMGPIEEAELREAVRRGMTDAMVRDEHSPAWVPLTQSPFASLMAAPVHIAAFGASTQAPVQQMPAPPKPQSVTWRQALVVVAVAAGGGWYMLDHAEHSGPNHRSASDDLPAPTEIIGASALAEEYAANEVRADLAHKGHRARVTGMVKQLGNALSTPYVYLAGSGTTDVHCDAAADQAPKVANITIGQTVTVDGTVNGKFADVLLKDCVVSP